jgi:UDP-N-acetylglucosamine--N-acetylmuramyl-(pentapeptide) pyrophosphoryl-undecaprenol N-acetylglucosamine transferase
MEVLIAGGGTAGHVFPAIAIADALAARGAGITYVGSPDGQEATLVPSAGYRFVPVRAISAQTRLSWRSLRAVARAIGAARSVRPLVARSDVVVGVGGFASAPAVLAARWTRRPLVLVDQNSVPGAVNRIGARWARVVATTFDATAAKLPAGTRVERTGNPVRREIVAVREDRARLAAEARTAFTLEEGRRTVLVVGGSLGALHLDEAVAGALGALRDRADLQLLVSTGAAHRAVVADAVEADAPLLVRVLPFIERMDLALAIADLAVSRAGASVAELAACSIPSILVPYPYATEHHQDANAAEVVAAGAAVSLRDAELSPSGLASCILELMDDDDRRTRMADAALAWARPDAAERIADLVTEAAEAEGAA